MRKTWKVAFCGLGSIGSRHLRDLQTVFSRRDDDFTVDLIRADKTRPVPEEFRGVIRDLSLTSPIFSQGMSKIFPHSICFY